MEGSRYQLLTIGSRYLRRQAGRGRDANGGRLGEWMPCGRRGRWPRAPRHARRPSSSLADALSAVEGREAAAITFGVAASGLTFLGHRRRFLGPRRRPAGARRAPAVIGQRTRHPDSSSSAIGRKRAR
jgi:hypothetical protein